jgi:hypothetical protein
MEFQMNQLVNLPFRALYVNLIAIWIHLGMTCLICSHQNHKGKHLNTFSNIHKFCFSTFLQGYNILNIYT